MYCSQCGTNNADDAMFCQKCGKQLGTTDQDSPTVASSPPAYAPTYNSSPYGSDVYGSTESSPPPPPPDASPAGVANPYEHAPLQAPQQKGHRRRWIVLGIIVLVLLAAIVGGSIVYLNRSTPTKTAQTACDAYARGDYLTVYDQFSSDYKRQQGSADQYASQARAFAQSHGGVNSCTITLVDESSSPVRSSAKAVYADGISLTFNDTYLNENGVWKISNITFS